MSVRRQGVPVRVGSRKVHVLHMGWSRCERPPGTDMHHVPPPRGPGQPLARYFGKYFVLSYKSTLYFVPSVAFVSLGPSVAFVPKSVSISNVPFLAAHGGVRKEGWPPLQPSASHTRRSVRPLRTLQPRYNRYKTVTFETAITGVTRASMKPLLCVAPITTPFDSRKSKHVTRRALARRSRWWPMRAREEVALKGSWSFSFSYAAEGPTLYSPSHS